MTEATLGRMGLFCSRIGRTAHHGEGGMVAAAATAVTARVRSWQGCEIVKVSSREGPKPPLRFLIRSAVRWEACGAASPEMKHLDAPFSVLTQHLCDHYVAHGRKKLLSVP